MVSPEHIDNQKTENQQAPSPAVKQQVPTEVEKKRPWLKPLMRVLGVVVPLIGGIAIMWLIIFASDVGNWLLPLPFILGIVGAVLLRSWWSILIVPIALFLGELLVVYLVPLLFFPNPTEVDDVGFGVGMGLIASPIIAAFMALISTSIVKKAQKPFSATMPKDF